MRSPCRLTHTTSVDAEPRHTDKQTSTTHTHTHTHRRIRSLVPCHLALICLLSTFASHGMDRMMRRSSENRQQATCPPCHERYSSLMTRHSQSTNKQSNACGQPDTRSLLSSGNMKMCTALFPSLPPSTCGQPNQDSARNALLPTPRPATRSWTPNPCDWQS